MIHLKEDEGVMLARRYADMTLPVSSNPVLVWDLLKREPGERTCQECSTHMVDPPLDCLC